MGSYKVNSNKGKTLRPKNKVLAFKQFDRNGSNWTVNDSFSAQYDFLLIVA